MASSRGKAEVGRQRKSVAEVGSQTAESAGKGFNRWSVTRSKNQENENRRGILE
ncbi:hypothetical protein BH11BAC1_BH11BAC1_15200 [soil metagenome]